MKTYVFPADAFGCGYYRLIWPARALRAAGHDVVIVMPHERTRMLQAGLNAAGQIVKVQVPPDADVIVFQRVTHRHLVSAIPLLRRQGVAVVVDVDDDLSAIHPQNVAFQLMHPGNAAYPDHSWRSTLDACRAATAVQVSTDALLPLYAPHGRGAVVRNRVPQRYLEIPRVDSTIIGWGGSMHSHPDDPQVMGNAITFLAREGYPFRVIGDGKGVRTALHLDAEPEVTGVVDLESAWPETLATLGVGVTPLADTRFNRAKSWLKPLECAAVGVPCVASPRAEYALLHREGIGVLAAKPQHWLRELRRLVTDDAARAELSESGRTAAARHTIENNAWRWAELWEDAYKIERAGRSTLVRDG